MGIDSEAAMGVKIALDAMGGDAAPDINLKGALSALDLAPDLSLFLVGQEEILRSALSAYPGWEKKPIEIVDAPEVISMDDHGATVFRKKKNSSISVGLHLVKEKKADAFVSAGNSGAIMAGALFTLGRVEGIERPPILIRMPNLDSFVSILDGGANVDCRPSHLVQFAEMGCIYAEVIEGIVNPKIGVLSNGSESHKGNDLTRETHAVLEKHKHLNYIGYVEGHDLFRGTADVVVCDGFVGNVVLKLSEGLADMAFEWFRREIRHDYLGIVGTALLRKTLGKFKKKFDSQPYGAAPLLGIDGMVLIGHGSSTEVAITNGLLTAKRGVEQRLTERVAERLVKLGVQK
jgi:phosphate acyltransferase